MYSKYTVYKRATHLCGDANEVVDGDVSHVLREAHVERVPEAVGEVVHRRLRVPVEDLVGHGVVVRHARHHVILDVTVRVDLHIHVTFVYTYT